MNATAASIGRRYRSGPTRVTTVQGSRDSWILAVPRAEPLDLHDRRTLHGFQVMLRSPDHRLFQEPRHLTAVRTLQHQVTVVVAGSQLVAVLKQTWGQQLQESHLGSLVVARYVFRQSRDPLFNTRCRFVAVPADRDLQRFILFGSGSLPRRRQNARSPSPAPQLAVITGFTSLHVGIDRGVRVQRKRAGLRLISTARARA
jgi:hypothetical protein